MVIEILIMTDPNAPVSARQLLKRLEMGGLRYTGRERRHKRARLRFIMARLRFTLSIG
jgi:hypothetical protein